MKGWLMERKDALKYGAILVYMLGNATTYNYLFKASVSTNWETSDVSFNMIKNLSIAMVWPLYWLYRAFMG